MSEQTGNPRFGIDQRPLRPTSLRELYELVVKIFPHAGHSEEAFIASIITQLERDAIRTRSLKSQVMDKNLNLTLPSSWPLNDFWYAAERYLKSLNIEEAEISKLWEVVRDGFR